MVKQIKHPLIEHKLSLMRDVNCSNEMFRKLLTEISILMGYELFESLPLEEGEEKITPTKGTYIAKAIKQRIVLLPILRAGLAMSEPLKDYVPNAISAHIGLRRNEETLKPEIYSSELPKDTDCKVFIFDPMLATGGSAIFALDFLSERGFKDISFVSLIASRKGLEIVEKAYPNSNIYVVAIDEILNDKGYIVPGLGDAGDRVFGIEKGETTR